jgi:ferrous iron transport protein A
MAGVVALVPLISDLTDGFRLLHTGIMLQLSGNKRQPVAIFSGLSMPTRKSRQHKPVRPLNLTDLRRGDEAILDRIDLPVDEARRLMELGFLPGGHIQIGRSAPGGDPMVFRVDGSEIALRRETAIKISIRRP